MKQDVLKVNGGYDSPMMTEVDITSEGILCASDSIDVFDWVEDNEGWN